MLLVLAVAPAAVDGSPLPEDLLSEYYGDIGADLLTGEAVVLRHSVQPDISFKKLLPPGSDLQKDAAATSKYRQYLSDRFDVRTGTGKSEETWEIFKVRYNGARKRLDQAVLTAAQYDRALVKELSLADIAWSRRFQVGNRMTSIDDQGPMKNDPQATVTSFHLGGPDFQHFGRSRCTPEQSEFMTKLLRSDQFVITGESTKEGYHVTATSDKSTITRIEAWFDLQQGNRIKRQRTFYRGVLMEEELFDGSIATPSGDFMPTKVVRRKFAPVPEAVVDAKTNDVSLKPMLSLEETYSVLSADFNLDIPDSVFVPDIPIGTTVYDRTISPAKTYRYGVAPKVMKNYVAKKAVPPPTSLGSRITFYLTVTGFLAVLGILIVRITRGKGRADGE
jgi:hypothetical protein